MRNRDKKRAKAIIVEIIRQAGGRFRNKTNLFKAFWRAHVAYASSHLLPLSDWPIVRMPQGPGIDRFDQLIGELMAEGVVETEEEPCGEFTRIVFHLATEGEGDLGPDEIEAIRAGVDAVSGQTAARVSDDSHDESRAWQGAKNGDEIDVFLDVMSDEEYAARERRMNELAEVFNAEGNWALAAAK